MHRYERRYPARFLRFVTPSSPCRWWWFHLCPVLFPLARWRIVANIQMNTAHLFDRLQIDLQVHGNTYRFYIEIALVAVLSYVAFTDFQTFKIQNNVVLLLLVLYALFAVAARTPSEILSNLILAAIIFAVLLWFYTRGVVGGGDVKFVSVACLWIGLHCLLLFSIALFVLISLHACAAWKGWAATKPMAGRLAIPYAPSVAGALIAMALFGCL